MGHIGAQGKVGLQVKVKPYRLLIPIKSVRVEDYDNNHDINNHISNKNHDDNADNINNGDSISF